MRTRTSCVGLAVSALFACTFAACVEKRGSERNSDGGFPPTLFRPPDMAKAVPSSAAPGCVDPGPECFPPPDLSPSPPDLIQATDLASPPDLVPPPDLAPLPPGAPCLPVVGANPCATWCDCLTHTCHAPVTDPRCSDNIQDGDESDVDCGGTACMPCSSGKSCQGGAGNNSWWFNCLACFCNENGNGNICP